jgi:GT2 family glycosyltransferase
MRLSVVIVNQNACLQLKHAVNSIVNACKGTDYELFVVDNASTDKSVEMVENEFPQTNIIANATDIGIAKANNQALKLVTGEYILIVSADTICCKDSLEKMFAFMDDHTDAGGLSVRMLSTQGRFLPESIHGLTTTWAAFLKLIGFAKYLSKTRLYDRNRKDWVEEFQIAEIDIINGACMFLRRSALNEIGLFDERFFMFGYDVDLSYRIRLAGFKNYYFPKTYIIKPDGHLLAKFSWNYIKYFYGAMFIFALKYLFKLPEIKVAGVPQLIPTSYEVK